MPVLNGRKRPWSAMRPGVIASAANAARYGYNAAKRLRQGASLAKQIYSNPKGDRQQGYRASRVTLYRVPTTTKSKTLYHKRRIPRRHQAFVRRRKHLRKKLLRLLKSRPRINALQEKTITAQNIQWAPSAGKTNYDWQEVRGANDAYGCWTKTHVDNVADAVVKVAAVNSSGSAIPTDDAYAEAYLKYIRHRLHLKNISGANGVIVDVYTCTARYTGNDPVLDTPKECWATQLLASSGNPTQPSINTKGQTPFDCPNFGKYWKINHVERLSFENLEAKVITMKCKTGKLPLPRSDVAAENNLTWAGKTMFWMLVIHPTIINLSWDNTTPFTIFEATFERTTHYVPLNGQGISFLGNPGRNFAGVITLTAPAGSD